MLTIELFFGPDSIGFPYIGIGFESFSGAGTLDQAKIFTYKTLPLAFLKTINDKNSLINIIFPQIYIIFLYQISFYTFFRLWIRLFNGFFAFFYRIFNKLSICKNILVNKIDNR